ncbi:retropepsin-like aspartic protease [Patescibacteria group bacterium]
MNNHTQPLEPISNHNPNQIKSSFSNFWLKIGYIFVFTILFITTGVIIIKNFYFQKTYDQDIILETNYQKSVWKDYGEVFEPIVEIPVYYVEKGYIPERFLLDSGALVSSLPREMAEPLGFSLAMLPRSTFRGFGNSSTFAYRAVVKTLLGKKEVNIPVVFTESTGSKSILGRTGFFEKYSITFNSKEQKVQIRN